MPRLRTIAAALSLATLALPAAAPAAERTHTLYIPAITCDSSAAEVELVLMRMEGITAADADIEEAAATVTFDDEAVTLEEIEADLADKGFPVTAVAPAP